MKKFLSVLMCLCLIIGTLTVSVVSVGAETSGDFEYKVLEDDTVEITKYNGSATALEIPSEIDGKAVTSIDGWAFRYRDCTSLTSVTIPDSVTSIGSSAFEDCTSLTSINVDENNSHYCDIDGVLFNKDKTELIQYPIGNTATSYTIPDSVTIIGIAFAYCTSLTSVTIPDSVTYIAYYAFEGCTSLTSVTIPDSVTSIGEFAFEDCRSLTSVTIPDSVTYIGIGAFAYCTSLTSINVDENNSHYCDIDGVLFNKDKTTILAYPNGKATTYSIPNTVTSIGDEAFNGCTALTSVTIPDSVTSIGYNAFRNCTSLTSITIPDSVTSIDWGAFRNCTSLISVTIPDSVTSIGNRAFIGCTSLTSIKIPDSVTSIGSSAFENCKSLTSVTIGDNVTSIGRYAFGYFYDNTEYVYVLLDDFTIKGYKDSEAEKYATDNGIKFVDLTNHTHTYTSAITKEPTCTEKGVKTFTCSCDESYTEEIPVLGHTEVVDKAVASTCTRTGLTEGKHCSVCDEVLVKQVVVPTKSHNYKWVVTKKASYVSKGTKSYKCSVCGKVAKTTSIAKLKLKTPSFSVSGGKKLFKIKYTKVTDATGFEVKYTIGKKTVTKTFSTKKSITKTISGLKKGSYKVQIRAFVKQGSKTAYSDRTTTKTVKVK